MIHTDRLGPLLKAALAAICRRLRHLLKRFEPDPQGRTKIFRDAAITGLQQFLEGMHLLPGLQQQPALQRILLDLALALQGIQPQELRDLLAQERQVEADLRHTLNQLTPYVARRKEKIA